MNSKLLAIMGVFTVAISAGVACADDDLTSLSYISYLERYASIQPSRGEETIEVQVNMPVMVGDRLETARNSRVEIQLADGSTVWLAEFATLDFDNIARSRDDGSARTVLNLTGGVIVVEIGENAKAGESAIGAVFLGRPGLYRLELHDDELRVETHQGLAELPSGVGSSLLRAGQQAWLQADGSEVKTKKAVLADFSDDFWSWVEERRNPHSGQTAQYVDSQNADRAAVLDSYGQWVYEPELSSWMWRPRVDAVLDGTVVLDVCRLVLDLLRAVGLVPLPLRLLVLLTHQQRLAVGLRQRLGPGMGALDVG